MMEEEIYIDVETVGCLREDGFSDALMDQENHTILVTVEHYIDKDDTDPEMNERFTMLDWWPPQSVADSVAKSHRRFVENDYVDCVRVAVGSKERPHIIYATRWIGAPDV